MPEKHPEPSRAQQCPDTLLRGGCALVSSALVEQTFSVETEIARLPGLFCPRSQKKWVFLTSDTLLEKKFSLAALPRDHNSWTRFTLTWLLE